MKRLLMTVIAVASVTACAGLPDLSVGSLARIGASTLPIGPEKEQEIGFGIAATVAGRYPILDDRELTLYVNRVGQAVAQEALRVSDVPFRFAVLDTDDVNAFAAPGGYILITRGSLAHMESEAELAGVLAHEVAHVDQSHVLNEIRKGSAIATARDEAQLNGPLLDAVIGAGAELLFTGLTREDEMEADSIAVISASAMGYRADGLVRFLDRMSAIEGEEDGGALRELRATHPSAADRADRLRRQIAATGIDPEAGELLVGRFRQHVSGRVR